VDPALAAFFDALPARTAFPEDTHAATAATLAEHHAAGTAAWPGVDVSPVDFAAELARRLGAQATFDALVACRAQDVYLLIACARGDEAALRALEPIVAREVALAGARTGARPDQIADAKGELNRALLTDEPGRRAAARSFAGRGDLRGYLRVVATRELVKIVQRGRREQPRSETALLAMLAPQDDPELSILKAKYKDAVSGCIRAAIDKLDERERALLSYQIVDGWNVDRVGALYGVHRATAARWIAAARETLGELIRKEIASQLEVAADEVDSIVRLVQSRVELSLERLIKA
jgi:RNA polymerase sigma-70 factor, ECF subfamily